LTGFTRHGAPISAILCVQIEHGAKARSSNPARLRHVALSESWAADCAWVGYPTQLIRARMPSALTRELTADQLKVPLTGVVILTHCAITYGAPGSWFYPNPAGGMLRTILGVPIALGALFAMGTFFFVAGCFVPAALRRKGTRRFVRDRMVRLAIPVALFIVIVVPALEWLIGAVTGRFRYGCVGRCGRRAGRWRAGWPVAGGRCRGWAGWCAAG
jgi:hypothetical protein